MGNCLALQKRVIKVMKTDGEILTYKAPTKVDQVLSDYESHAISDTLPVVRHLRGDTDLIGGQLYYLLPLPKFPSLEIIDKKKLSGSKLELKGAGEEINGVVRIKLVITKQELEAMLKKGVSFGDLVSRVQENESLRRSEEFHDEGSGDSRVWKPLLERIPE